MPTNIDEKIERGLVQGLIDTGLLLKYKFRGAMFGPDVCDEAERIRYRVDSDSRRLAVVREREGRWKERYIEFGDALSNFYLSGKNLDISFLKFYNDHIRRYWEDEVPKLPEEMKYDMWYPALAALQTKNRAYTTPFETNDELEEHEVEFHRNIGAMALPLMANSDRIDIALMDGSDPIFEVKRIIGTRHADARKNMTIVINTAALKGMVDNDKRAQRYLKDRSPTNSYSIEGGKTYLIPSTIQGIPEYDRDFTSGEPFFF